MISLNLKVEDDFSLNYEQSIYSLKYASAQACETETKKAGERHLMIPFSEALSLVSSANKNACLVHRFYIDK